MSAETMKATTQRPALNTKLPFCCLW